MARLTPLYRGQAPPLRPVDVPRLITPPLLNAVMYWDDFWGDTVAPYRFTDSGGIASNWGSPTWWAFQPAGTTGQVGCHGSNAEASQFGTLNIQSGTGAGDTMQIGTGGKVLNPGNDFMVFGNPRYDSLGMWRLRVQSGGAGRLEIIWGAGWIGGGFADSTNWVTDPDAVFVTSQDRALIIHHSNSAYSGAGAGDIVARYYNPTVSANQMLTLVTGADPETMRKFEISSLAGVLRFYVDDDYKGSITADWSATEFRACAGITRTTIGGTPRALILDAYYHEISTGADPR
jgi:hypothetical protein